MRDTSTKEYDERENSVREGSQAVPAHPSGKGRLERRYSDGKWTILDYEFHASNNENISSCLP
jgi:hypothetical protein